MDHNRIIENLATEIRHKMNGGNGKDPVEAVVAESKEST